MASHVVARAAKGMPSALPARIQLLKMLSRVGGRGAGRPENRIQSR